MKIIILLIIIYLIYTFVYNKLKYEDFKNKSKISFPVYWINLDRSKDRREFILKQFEKNNITNHQRISAVDGKNLSSNLIKKINENNNKSNKRNLYKGEIGCYLSHCKIFKKLRKHDIIMILEDDIKFEDNFINRLEVSLKELPDKWDLLLIGYRFLEPHKNINYSENLQKTKSKYNGTHAYLINSNILPKIRGICDHDKISIPIDDLYSTLLNKLIVFNTKDKLITSYSDDEKNFVSLTWQ